MSRIPFAVIPEPLAKHIETVGGKPINLYRVLANNPKLLQAWLDLAYPLRAGNTPRKLRELMILRTAQMNNSTYEWVQHLKMAKAADVPANQIEQLDNWRQSNAFNDIEKAVLELTEGVVHNQVSDEVYANATKHFSQADMIELLLTASFYCMVSRFLNAIGITTQGEEQL